MACSRMPKCMLRPPYESASKSPAPSKVMRVLVDGVRSAEPPISQGRVGATAFSTLADASGHDDQGGPIGRLRGGLEGLVEPGEVVRVRDPGHAPAVADEAGGHVVAEGQAGVALDGDPVVVVDPAEVAELQVAGQGGG